MKAEKNVPAYQPTDLRGYVYQSICVLLSVRNSVRSGFFSLCTDSALSLSRLMA